MLLVNLFLLVSAAFAGGTMTLSGEIHGFDAKTIQVSDGQHIYVLERDKIFNKAPLAKGLKRGDHVEVNVDFEGVVETREVAKK